MRFSVSKIKVGLPFQLGSVELRVNHEDRQAAWELYVELVTRIAVQPLDLDHGLAREALSSLHSLFETTRVILRRAGPRVGASRDSVGGIAIAALNRGVRPFLAKWHPLLQAHEETRSPGTKAMEHERAWADEAKLRGELDRLRASLGEYAEALGKIAGVA